MSRLAIVFDNLGPYHVARLRAARDLFDLSVIEYQDQSNDYSWSRSDFRNDLNLKTLLTAGTRLTNAESRRLVCRQLDLLLPDVVAVPGWSHHASFAALDWCTRHYVPVIMMSDSTELDAMRVAWRERVKSSLLRLAATCLVAGSRHRDYVVKLGFPEESVFLGYDAVDNEYFFSRAEEARLRKLGDRSAPPELKSPEPKGSDQQTEAKPNLDLPESFFLASARFIEKKNLPQLLLAYARYRGLCPQPSAISNQRSHQPWSLVLLGDGPLRFQLNHLVSELRLQGSVYMPGFKQYDELGSYYGLAEAFVHASTTDQWGLVVNEAMASGLPVLVSNRCGCAADLVQEGCNGFTFDPFDVNQLASLMHRITGMEQSVRRKMGLQSQKIIAHWDTDRFAQGLLAAANKAIEVGPKRHTPLQRLLPRLLVHRT